MVTHTVWETVHAPDKIVFVDQDGNFISEGFAAAATPPPSVVVDPQVPAPAPAEEAGKAAAPGPGPGNYDNY